ncbi:(d)CMP kinase [Plantibacter sp. VKM Ac-2880]|uniref:uridine kinase family protein n=1 Tax=Plantibacter sp. VKM Ac-2880 TaxID=2783827 RepID=UPI00188E300D|nr:AAA family ATPase [Plantibacter sp. VKM Ac-2880]MBF4570883.1 (d)CMP kinase [Plantibacter sp. VKM Ac-2880]
MTSPDPTLIESIAQHALNAPVPGVRIIGVDGPSGSGKSTLARPLAGRLNAPVIEVDDFVSWVDFSGWWPRFEKQVLEPLLAGDDAVYQRRDWAGDEFGSGLGEWRTVPWASVVVVEGVTCTREAAADHLACRIWVEAAAEERLRRGLERDGHGATHRGRWKAWMDEEDVFFPTDGARARADFIVTTG